MTGQPKRRSDRPNGGRELVVEIMSADVDRRLSLEDLHERTKETMRRFHTDLDSWPPKLEPYFEGAAACRQRWVRTDDNGQVYDFVLIDCGPFDIFAGVGSRRSLNLGDGRSGNLATDVVLEALSTSSRDDPEEPLYGILTTYELDRVWRNNFSAAAIHQHAKDWQLVLRSEGDTLDYAMPGTDLMAVVRSNQAATSADRVVIGGARAKTTAHENGHLKYASGQVHCVVSVDRAGQYSYNHAAVAAIREIARLRLEGHGWDELAASHGHLLPATRSTNERDIPGHGRKEAGSRTRKERNRRRIADGKPPLPFRVLEDGSPNPDWRPLTIADLHAPGAQLRAVFYRGMSVPADHRERLSSRVDLDLDGIHPTDASLAFFGDGKYRRLTVDHDRSNSQVRRYRYSIADLGPVDEKGFILDTATVEALQAARGKPSNGSTSGNPATAVFSAAQHGPLYRRGGYMCPGLGSVVVRTFSDSGGWGLRIWFEPLGARAHMDGCVTLASLEGPDVCAMLAEILEEALKSHPGSATFTFRTPPTVANPAGAAAARVAAIAEEHSLLTDRLLSLELPPIAAERIAERLQQVEAQLADAQDELERAERPTGSPDTPTYDGEFDITDLADVVALLRLGRLLPPQLAKQVARLLQRLLPEATLTIDPACAEVVANVVLVMTNDDGELRLPLSGRLPNRSNDPWLTGIAGAWWIHQQPLDVLFARRGLDTIPSQGTRWRAPIAKRLLDESERSGACLPGPHTAGLLSRSPTPELVQASVELVTGSDPTNPELVSAIKAQMGRLDGDPKCQRWDKPGWCDVLALARELAPMRPADG